MNYELSGRSTFSCCNAGNEYEWFSVFSLGGHKKSLEYPSNGCGPLLQTMEKYPHILSAFDNLLRKPAAITIELVKENSRPTIPVSERPTIII